MAKSYLAYKYSLKTETDCFFLFGFIVSYENYIDKEHYSKKIDINVAKFHKFEKNTEEFKKSKKNHVEIECRLVDEENYAQFYNNIEEKNFSFNALSFTEKSNSSEMPILYTTEAFLEVPKYEMPVISAHKYKNIWLTSNLSTIDYQLILPIMYEYATPFFSKEKTNSYKNIPFGSFFLMQNTFLFKENFIETSTDFKEPYFKITLSKNYDFENHTMQVKLNSITHQDTVNKIIPLGKDKEINIEIAEPTPQQTIKIFDNYGDLMYYEYVTRIVSFNININTVGNSIAIRDKLSKNNKDLEKINHIEHPTHTTTSAVDNFEEKYKLFCRYHDTLRLQLTTKSMEEEVTPSFWFKKMSSTECITKIKELVSKANEVVFFDPFFETLDNKTNTDTFESTQNLFLILMRLTGNVTIVSSTKNGKFLSEQFENLTGYFLNAGLQISLRVSAEDMHDRYLFLSKNNEISIYNLTNSLNSAMSNYPLGIIGVNGEYKEELKDYLTKKILPLSKEIYNSKEKQSKYNSTNTNSKYLQELIGNLELKDSFIDENFEKILKDFEVLYKNKPIIALLAIAELLAYIYEDDSKYTHIKDILISKIKGYSEKAELLKKLEKYIATLLTQNSGIHFTQKSELSLESELNIESYKKNSFRYPYHNRNYYTNKMYGVEYFLHAIFTIEPDTFMTWLENTTSIIAPCGYNYLEWQYYQKIEDLLNCKSNTLKLLGLQRLFDNVFTKENIIKSIDKIQKAIESNIPKELIYCIVVQNFHIFYDKQKYTFDENYLALLTDDFFDDIIITEQFNKDLYTSLQPSIYDSTSVMLFLYILRNAKFTNEENRLELTLYFFARYFEKEDSSFWYSFSTDYSLQTKIIQLIMLFDINKRGKILRNLYSLLKVEDDYNKASFPLLSNITQYKIHSEKLQKIHSLLYIFCVCDDKSFEYAFKPINLLLSLRNRKTHNVHQMLLLVQAVFYCILKSENINKNTIQPFFYYLNDTAEIEFFALLYKKRFSENSLNALYNFISTFYEENSYKNDERVLLDISLSTMCHIVANVYKSDKDKMKEVLQNIETITNVFFEGKYTVSLPRYWEET